MKKLVAAITVTIGLGLAPAAQAISGTVTTTVGPYEADVTFTNPFAASGYYDPSILNQEARLISQAPSGATVYLATYEFKSTIVRGAIDTALANGVHVVVLHDGTDTGSNLEDANGIQHVWCHTGGAGSGGCVSSNPTGLMHAKYMLITQTKDAGGTFRPWVVWFASANQVQHSGAETMNDSVTVYGDQTLYDDFFGRIWTPMWNVATGAQAPYANNDWYYPSIGRGYFKDDGSLITTYASPEQDTDTLANRLDYVNPGTGCEVRVMQSTIHNLRPEVISQLDRIRGGGCSVYVVATGIQNEALCDLQSHDVHVRKINQYTIPSNPDKKTGIHDKVVLIHSRYNGSSAIEDHVITGSHNITKSALRYNDELLVKIGHNTPVYNAFKDHFHDAYTDNAVGYPCGSGT